MARRLREVLYVGLVITVVVGVDTLFLRHHVEKRLLVNGGIVVVFAALGWPLLRKKR